MAGKINVKVIVGSTRQGRFSEKPARFIFDELKKKNWVEVELLDLRDYPMPFFDDPSSPSAANGKYLNAEVQKWAGKIKEADAFIIVAPEYNHGYPGVLKNALDSIYQEWAKKAIGFVSYGGVSGARSVEQLRLVAIELQMVPIRNSLHLPLEIYMKAMNEAAPVNPEIFQPLRKGYGGDKIEGFFNELFWYANALKSAREKESS